MADISPFAPKRFPRLPKIAGLRLGGVACGIKANMRSDLMVCVLDPGARVAGMFTRSATAGPTVRWCRDAVRDGAVRAIVVNSGNANVFTGRAGARDVAATAVTAARALGCGPGEIMVSSTGVIGERLPISKLTAALPGLVAAAEAGAWQAAAEAIRTTDTFPKAAGARARIGGVAVNIAGIAKGSGMIAPDMATMLAYVFTDAKIPAPALRVLLAEACQASFNAITVDGDTSTSDTVLLVATGAGRGHRRITRAGDPALADFRAKLGAVMTDLAHQIVGDGEGLSKFITITVTGAASDRAAKAIALSVANSPLVKTAVAGEDANWGRIVMAVGKAGERVDPQRLAIKLGGVRITERGAARPSYREAPVARHMKGRRIRIDIGAGIKGARGRATVWTCDLTHGYISINADYRS